MSARSSASGSVRPSVRLVRAWGFSASHRYFNSALTEEENRKLYGSLYREKGFGHNFRMEAHVEGPIDPLTGMIVNLVDIDRWLKEVTDELDHQHLNALPFFQGGAPTPERIALFLFQEIQKRMKRERASDDPVRLLKVRLYEGQDGLWVDCAE